MEKKIDFTGGLGTGGDKNRRERGGVGYLERRLELGGGSIIVKTES